MHRTGKFYVKLATPDGVTFPTHTSIETGSLYYRNDERLLYIYSGDWLAIPTYDDIPNIGDALRWDGKYWVASGVGGGVGLDHGSLTGLSDDDHTQYLLNWDNILVVHPAGSTRTPGYYTSIQTAINAANTGDTILIMPGTYTENLTLADGVHLKGIAPPQNGISGTPPVKLLGSVTINASIECTITDMCIYYTDTSASAISALDASGGYLTLRDVDITCLNYGAGDARAFYCHAAMTAEFFSCWLDSDTVGGTAYGAYVTIGNAEFFNCIFGRNQDVDINCASGTHIFLSYTMYRPSTCTGAGSYHYFDNDSIAKALVDTTLPSNWDAGDYEIRSSTFESDVATGTAPLTVASTTKVTNLNAEQVDDAHADNTPAANEIPILNADADLNLFTSGRHIFQSTVGEIFPGGAATTTGSRAYFRRMSDRIIPTVSTLITHFRPSATYPPTGYSWLTTTGFTTPASAVSSSAYDYLAATASASSACFLAQSITTYLTKTLWTRVTAGFAGLAGLRVDNGYGPSDSTNERHVMVYLDGSANDGTATLKFQYKTSSSAPTINTSGLSISIGDMLVISLYIYDAGATWSGYGYIVHESGSNMIQNNFSIPGQSWTISRGGIYLANATASAMGYCYWDWYHTNMS